LWFSRFCGMIESVMSKKQPHRNRRPGGKGGVSHFSLGGSLAAWLATGLSALLLFSLLLPRPILSAQESEVDLNAHLETLLSTMTVEEKVGQLFLVAFVGNDAGPGSDIAKLIRQDQIGAVVLLASNSNFHNNEETPRQVARLTNSLQALAMQDGVQVPLFIAIDHEGDGYPYTRIRGGTTALPNAMAIGATWDLDNARNVGQVTGLELAAMGVNLLLGPDVDVLSHPRPTGQGDMGTRTFGGNPWWVGEMGSAYIEGVHQGSSGRVATVAKHFPGHGGSDRLPDEEVATVDKSLEELQRVELAPFFAVTQDDGSARSAILTDALMSSHIRYRGLQGDIRQFTAPISFDAAGMGDILKLEEFQAWRPTGLMVSDSLGVPAVRRYFDPTLTNFPHRRIAKEAFLAGNDLLLLAQFGLSEAWADQLHNIRDTVAFFREEYRSNATFAARVDEAVTRILRLKLKLYPEFALEAVKVHPDAALQVCGLGGQVSQSIANEALTLLFPDANALPPAPRQGEQILIFTDARPVQECFTAECQPFPPLSQTAVEQAILRVYGADGTGQIDEQDVTSLPFGQLKAFLADGEVQHDIGTLLREADWILVAQQDLNPVKGPNSDAVKLFLNDPLSTSYKANLVVLAFNAPYYLDTTEISKLSLYLAAYSKTEPFVEAAVRALFGELVPQGAPPVDVEGINYELQRWLSPDPDRTIPLVLVEPASGPFPQLPVSVRLRAGPILDHNGHPVPDGTLVTFRADYEGGAQSLIMPATTVGGVAETTATLQDTGQIRFRAESGDSVNSQVVALTVQTPPTNTPTPTRAPIPTPTPTWTPTTTPTSSPAAIPSPTTESKALPSVPGPARPVDGTDLLLAAGTTLLVAAVGFLFLSRRKMRRALAVRWILLAVIGGMAGYILYAAKVVRPETWVILPDVAWVPRAVVAAIAGIFALIPLGLVARTKAES
jgi:beta-N-acetylhexosaminidase